MFRMLGIQLNPLLGAIIGVAAVAIGLGVDRPFVAVAGGVMLVISGARAVSGKQK